MNRFRKLLVSALALTASFGVFPIAFGLNINFVHRDITIGAPSTQWWIQLSTAIVFGLGFATILTLIVTPAALMLFANMRSSRQRFGAWLRRDRSKKPPAASAGTATPDALPDPTPAE